MRKILAFLFACVISASSFAADNTVILTPGSGVTMRTQDVGSGVQSPYNILGNTSGTSIYGTAGTSNAAVLSIQGITSGTAVPMSAASGAFASGAFASGSMVDFLTTRGTKAPGTAAANSLLTGCVYTAAGITLTDGQQAACQATSTGGLLVSVANANANGPATPANSSPVVQAGMQYETIAAGTTAQVMGGSGATGDYLSHCVVYPTSTSPGVLTVFDSTSSATNNAIAFAGGSSSTSNLVPFSIPVGAFSVNGAWKVTTGANMVATCYGKFSA